MAVLLHMTNPRTGQRESYRTADTKEEVQRQISELFEPAGYTAFEIEEQADQDTSKAGVYYFFDCMNAFITDRYFDAAAFESEKDAIRTAANYEATLYRCTFDQNGEQIDRSVIYDPYACFGE